ncbi:hypothetical protein PQI07_22485 [Methylobacterium sp. 092160098-2]|uniref:hypothetical protein n=1 Tax=Methylobacterium sp. 092160098-2 TaxID=3025129 RepID=UPI002381A5C7|nr:hypothetical protein [Methylobacterium sp. 092160098-2]MDE4913451.1 hypothetical protein [Methylobacterium sp. 092160098-2]
MIRNAWLIAFFLATHPVVARGGYTPWFPQDGAQGSVGPAGAPKRIERYTAVANASGIAIFTWTACTSTADVDVITGWVTINGLVQMVTGAVVTQSLSGATANVKVSQGTLALTASPFTTAPQGTNLTVRMMCN